MTPQEIAEARPRLLDFAAEMLGGLPRKDQRAAGELYVRGLLAGGQRKSMVPMAERLGVDHQRLQQFITSSTWGYVAVRRNVARWFASSQPVEALVQVSQRQQAINGERAAAVRDNHERISGHDIGPPGRQREQLAVLVVQVDPVLTPVLAVRDELEVLSEQRMEQVGYPDASVPIIRIGCR